MPATLAAAPISWTVTLMAIRARPRAGPPGRRGLHQLEERAARRAAEELWVVAVDDAADQRRPAGPVERAKPPSLERVMASLDAIRIRERGERVAADGVRVQRRHFEETLDTRARGPGWCDRHGDRARIARAENERREWRRRRVDREQPDIARVGPERPVEYVHL